MAKLRDRRIVGTVIAVLVCVGSVLGFRALRDPHLPPGAHLVHVNLGHISGIAFSPDSKEIAIAGWDPLLRLYNVATGKRIRQWNASPRPHFDIAYAPHKNELTVSHDVLSISRWDMDTGKEIVPSLWPPMMGGSVRYSADGKYLAASGMASNTVCVWEAASGRPRFVVRGFRIYPSAIEFSPNGKWLAVTDRSGAYLFDTSTGKRVRSLPGKYVTFVAFSPDSSLIAFGGPYTPVYIRQTSDGQSRGTITEYDIQRAIFAPNGKSLIVAQMGNLLAFDLEGRFHGNLSPTFSPPGYLMRMFPPLRKLQRLPIASLTFSPDGRFFAYAAADIFYILPSNSLKLP